MSRKPSGFTLIELMIVVAIIAIISSIAIPSLLRARMAANEVSAMGILHTIATGQVSFRRQDYTFLGGTPGVMEYAKPLTYLHKLDDGTVLDFVDVSVSNAHFLNGTGTPRNGYYFMDLQNFFPGGAVTSVVLDYRLRYGITAIPAEYNLTGINSLYRDDKGVTFQADTGFNVASDAPSFLEMHDNPQTDGFITSE